jgi:hypothetical protein
MLPSTPEVVHGWLALAGCGAVCLDDALSALIAATLLLALTSLSLLSISPRLLLCSFPLTVIHDAIVAVCACSGSQPAAPPGSGKGRVHGSRAEASPKQWGSASTTTMGSALRAANQQTGEGTNKGDMGQSGHTAAAPGAAPRAADTKAGRQHTKGVAEVRWVCELPPQLGGQ